MRFICSHFTSNKHSTVVNEFLNNVKFYVLFVYVLGGGFFSYEFVTKQNLQWTTVLELSLELQRKARRFNVGYPQPPKTSLISQLVTFKARRFYILWSKELVLFFKTFSSIFLVTLVASFKI